MLKLAWIATLFVVACTFGPGNIQIRHSTDIESRKIRRIAVIPPAGAPERAKPKSTLGTAVATPQISEGAVAETLARQLYATMVSLPGWQIVGESEVREIAESVAADNQAARLRRIGEMVYADAVLVGRVLRYRERVGDKWGAKSPASVSFVLDLIDVRRGDVVWSARFDETQQALSENILAIADIRKRGVRWLTAEELMHEGVKKAVAQLHPLLVRSAG